MAACPLPVGKLRLSDLDLLLVGEEVLRPDDSSMTSELIGAENAQELTAGRRPPGRAATTGDAGRPKPPAPQHVNRDPVLPDLAVAERTMTARSRVRTAPTGGGPERTREPARLRAARMEVDRRRARSIRRRSRTRRGRPRFRRPTPSRSRRNRFAAVHDLAVVEPADLEGARRVDRPREDAVLVDGELERRGSSRAGRRWPRSAPRGPARAIRPGTAAARPRPGTRRSW